MVWNRKMMRTSGSPANAVKSAVRCTQPAGYVATGTDCDDVDGSVHPDADEVCDGVDNDCDTCVDECEDQDEDGWDNCAASDSG